MGVFAIPTVASGTLRDLAEQDQLAHLVVATSPLDDAAIEDLAEMAGVEAIGVRTTAAVPGLGNDTIRVVGFDQDIQSVNVVSPTEGRYPGEGEAIVSDGVAEIGESILVADTNLDVVGVGGTTWWSDTDAVFVTEAQA